MSHASAWNGSKHESDQNTGRVNLIRVCFNRATRAWGSSGLGSTGGKPNKGNTLFLFIG